VQSARTTSILCVFLAAVVVYPACILVVPKSHPVSEFPFCGVMKKEKDHDVGARFEFRKLDPGWWIDWALGVDRFSITIVIVTICCHPF
jgi:hypothetical protein